VLRERLGGNKTLRECSGYLRWPKCGVYFFLSQAKIARKAVMAEE